MSEQELRRYERFAGSREWTVIDRAISQLANDRALQETSDHPYIVGYLCEALLSQPEPQHGPMRSHEEVVAIINAAREEFRAANPLGRNPLAELLAERREAAARGD